MTEEIRIPDIGGAEQVDVIEILVSVGDRLAVNDPLITLEGDKATMEVPVPKAGVVASIALKVGDKVSEGTLILTLEQEEECSQSVSPVSKASEPNTVSAPIAEERNVESTADSQLTVLDLDEEDVYAGPGVRRIAHEFGVPLEAVKGTGLKGRILKEDIQRYVKTRLSRSADSDCLISSVPMIDFSQFGSTETEPLSKIRKQSGINLARHWSLIPHVTQFDEADITSLEAFRQSQKTLAASKNIRLTLLVFIMKAIVAALQAFPRFNSSLDVSRDCLIYKKYFNVGVAVETPKGLVVPVIREVDKKGCFVLAKELSAISQKAREKGLSLSDMQGGCFTISNLGGVGGLAFTPIINAPEVAILGVSQSRQRAVVQSNGDILPRLMLPLSLSYDHRVIDGAEAARFIVFLSNCLADVRRLLL